MTRDRQRLVILSLLRDDPRRDPELSDLDAALERILAQREEISELQRRLRAAREKFPDAQAVIGYGRRHGGGFVVIRGGAHG